jgi:hypothetical protein
MAEVLKDILEHLRDVYVEDENSCCNSDDSCKKQTLVIIDKFVEYGREHLKNNPPVTTRFEDAGIGLQLQDGTRLVFAHYTVDGAEQIPSVPITAPSVGVQGVRAMRVDNTSVAVTGDVSAPDWDRMEKGEKSDGKEGKE